MYPITHESDALIVPKKITLFHLPAEIRERIYIWRFGTQDQDFVVRPTRRWHGNPNTDEPDLHLSNIGALLRTCQQVYEEVTPLLYGLHTFYFSDHQHGPGETEVDMTEYCGKCQESLALDDPSTKACPFANSDFEHLTRFPECDYVLMKNWLHTIGPRNRSFITSIQLHFTGCQFTMLLEQSGKEPDEVPWNYYSPPDEGWPAAGGDLLKEALYIIYEECSLSRMRLSIEGIDIAQGEWLGGSDQWSHMLCAVDNLFVAALPMSRVIRAARGLEAMHIDIPARVFDSLYADYYASHPETFPDSKLRGMIMLAEWMLNHVANIKMLTTRKKTEAEQYKNKAPFVRPWTRPFTDQVEYLERGIKRSAERECRDEMDYLLWQATKTTSKITKLRLLQEIPDWQRESSSQEPKAKRQKRDTSCRDCGKQECDCIWYATERDWV